MDSARARARAVSPRIARIVAWTRTHTRARMRVAARTGCPGRYILAAINIIMCGRADLSGRGGGGEGRGGRRG